MSRKSRASNGMGSIRQRPDGRWEARYTTPDGRQRSVYAKTEKEVTAKLRNALHDLDTSVWHEPSRMTVAEWLTIWLTDYQAHTSTRTQRVYQSVARLHIIPTIGAVRIEKLLPLHIRLVISAMVDKGLAPSYVTQCHNILSCALSCAVESGLLRDNPARGIKTPRIVRKPLTIVDRELIPDFIRAARVQKIGLALIFLLMTGIRSAELRGLKWVDFDLEKATLSIQRQLPPKGHEFIPPKDGSSRLIQLTPEAVAILAEQKRHQAEQRLRAGSLWKTGSVYDGLVFRTESGNIINSSVLYNAVRAVGVEIGLPTLHPHDLRHSYAVAALRSGVDVKTVQHNLGHRSAAMTLDVYAAYTTDAGKRGAEKLSEYLKNALILT